MLKGAVAVVSFFHPFATVFSPETVNIKKLADLTANTKNCGRITLSPIQTHQSAFVLTLDFRPLADTPFL